MNANGFRRKISRCLHIFMTWLKCYPSGPIASTLFRKLQWTWTLCQWPLAPPPLFCFKKMGSAAFLGLILSNWATPWTEQTCGGECSQRSRKPVLPRGYSYRHNEAPTRWGLRCTRHALMSPLGNPPPLVFLKQADTCAHTCRLPRANHAKFHLIRVISPRAPRHCSGPSQKV